MSAVVRVLLAGLALAACRHPDWDVSPRLRAPDADVAAALGDTSRGDGASSGGDEVPEIAYPRALRPCCAFGADLKVEMGRVPLPGVEVGNLLAPEDQGKHRYDNGALSIQRGDPRSVVDREHNGLVYTCRGGFLDLAHVRDNADNTLALTAAIARGMERGTALELPAQGGAIRIHVRAIPAAAIAKYGRMALATALAQWLAYQVSIWHEIATFYGYTAIAGWPEKLSAFSPEDLYSNQIGVRLAGGIVLAKGARSDLEYGLSMDAWLERALQRLDAVPLADSREAMLSLDGLWWDSHKRLPDWTLVKRRALDAGPFLRPWRLEDSRAQPLAGCRDAGPPLVLYVPDGFAGAAFRDYAALEIDVDDALVAAGFPLPRPPERRVTAEDFPHVVDAVREAVVAEFGPGADAP